MEVFVLGVECEISSLYFFERNRVSRLEEEGVYRYIFMIVIFDFVLKVFKFFRVVL